MAPHLRASYNRMCASHIGSSAFLRRQLPERQLRSPIGVFPLPPTIAGSSSPSFAAGNSSVERTAFAATIECAFHRMKQPIWRVRATC